jgi:hypothetical protein
MFEEWHGFLARATFLLAWYNLAEHHERECAMIDRRTFAFGAVVYAALLLALCGCGDERSRLDQQPIPENSAPDAAISIDRATKTVRLRATIRPAHYGQEPTPYHHLITWGNGKAGPNALFATEATDSQVLKALEMLGGTPGNNLTRETWEKAEEADHPDPDLHAKGDIIAVSVTWDGLNEPLPIRDLLDGGELDLRFAGNEKLIPVWESGCIVCMQSCPGSKIANAPYTMREYVNGKGRIKAKEGVLPKDGTEVMIMIQLVK